MPSNTTIDTSGEKEDTGTSSPDLSQPVVTDKENAGHDSLRAAALNADLENEADSGPMRSVVGIKVCISFSFRSRGCCSAVPVTQPHC